jgi:hypothetical protein
MATVLTKSFADLIAPAFQNLSVALIRQDGTECTGGGYQRQTLVSVSTSEDTDYVYLTNANQISFPLATEDIAPATNPVAKVQLLDSNNNVIATVDLTEAKPYLNQDQVFIPQGGFVIKIPKNNT